MLFKNSSLSLKVIATLLLGIIPTASAYESSYTKKPEKNKKVEDIFSVIFSVIFVIVMVYLIYKCCCRRPKDTTMYIYEEEEPVPVNNSDNINNGNNNTIVNINFNGDTATNGGVINKGQVNGNVYSGGTNVTGSNSGNYNSNTSVVVPQTSMANTSAVYTPQPIYSPPAAYVPVAGPYSYYPQPGMPVVPQGVPVGQPVPVSPVSPSAPTAPFDTEYK